MVVKQLFSSVIVFLFLSTQCLFAYQTENKFWLDRRQASLKSPLLADVAKPFPSAIRCFVPPAFLKEHGKLLAALSPSHGTLRKIALAKTSVVRAPVVIHIQDVHMNLEAQEHIRETVLALGKTGLADVVALEGASGKINLEPFWQYPNLRAVAVMAQYLLKERKISGPIHAGLSLAQGQLPFVGVDDPTHYKSNIQAYRNSVPLQGAVRAQLRRLSADLAREKRAVYSPALLTLDQTVNDYHAGKISLGVYAEGLGKFKTPSGVAHSFLTGVQFERSLDPEKVETERTCLIERLSLRLNGKDREALLAQSVLFRAGQGRSVDFYSYLNEVCHGRGVLLKDYPALEAYVQYLKLTDGIDAEKLMIDMDAWEQSAFDRLAVSPEERELVALSRHVWLAQKLVDFDLTRLEWGEYDGRKEKILDGKLNPFEFFYQEADARDFSMGENLLKTLNSIQKDRAPVGVLITGGYHANGIADQLTRHGVTVISFVPKIGHVEGAQGSTYLSVFSQEKTPLEKLFLGERLFLSPPPDQGLAFEGTLLVPMVDVLGRGISAGEVQSFITSRIGQDVRVTLNESHQLPGELNLNLQISQERYIVRLKTTRDLEIVSVITEPGSSDSFLVILKEFLSRFSPGKEKDLSKTLIPGGKAHQATIEKDLVRIEKELKALGLHSLKLAEVMEKVRFALETGQGFIRPKDPVRLVVYGDPKTRLPVIGPLPSRLQVEDLVSVGDLDFAVAFHGEFWHGSSYVIPFTPDKRVAFIQLAWGSRAGTWSVPGGGIMPGYTAEQTAVSEVRDELGLSSHRSIPVEKMGTLGIDPGHYKIQGYQIAHLFRAQLTESEFLELKKNKRVLEDQRTDLGDEKLMDWLGEQTLAHEGTGEISGIGFFTEEQLLKSLRSAPHSFVPEIHIFHAEGLLSLDPVVPVESGRATAVRWLKAFEKVGAFVGGKGSAVRWGAAYKDYAPTIEFLAALITLLVAVGGSYVLPGSPLEGVVSPLLGAVFGWRFYHAHFQRPSAGDPLTEVHVSQTKAFAMAVIYGILIGVTPFLVGFGPADLQFFSPALAGTGWGLAMGLHQFFDRKPSATNAGRAVARHLIHHLSTIPKALGVLSPLSTDRTNQLLNTGPFVPDRLDQSLRRLKNDLEFRAGFLEEVGLTFRAEKLSPLQVSLLSALLSATGEPLGIIHFLGDDPDAELERIEKYSSRWVRITVVAPVHQESSLWQRTESLKTMGVHVIRKSPGTLGWTGPLLGELEAEMAEWLRSVPSSLMATVGKGIIINANEIDRLDKDSRLKSALSNVGGLADALELFLRILQAVQINA